jgi:Fur family ferric uptake transcriptional regulator
MMRGAYNTRQKRELQKFLMERSMQHFSVDEVVFELRDRGEKVGRSTVYRYLEQLAEQGSVRKYPGVQGVTQYQHVDDAASCDAHFHMLCRRCGNLMHVDCRLMGVMADHLMAEHGFQLDPRETLLVGVCEKCRADGGEAVAHGVDHHEECHDCL